MIPLPANLRLLLLLTVGLTIGYFVWLTTPARLTTGEVVQPSPPLASFPGSLERDVVGAVRVLLSDEVAGLTGQVVHADAGRSWR